LLKEADGTLASLSQGGILEPDITDRASVETDRALELRTRDRARKLISKIDQALGRIESALTVIVRKAASRSDIRAWKPVDSHHVDRSQERNKRMERGQSRRLTNRED